MNIAVDFDGTCVKFQYPNVGQDIPGAADTLKKFVDQGHNIILFTMRSSKSQGPLSDAIQWFKDNDIPLWGIQTNPQQKDWTSSPKAWADLYIDDASLGAFLSIDTDDDGKIQGKPYIDWTQVDDFMTKIGMLK